jgi:transposase
MQARPRFSTEFKEATVKKLLNRGNQTIEQFCEQNNVAISTVGKWQSNCASVLEMKTKKNKSKYSPEKILQIISETYSLSEEELGLYLRKNGLHSNQLTEWRTDFLALMNQPKPNSKKKDERDLKIKDLEKNLFKKNAALAEVSALLILQKKANLLWPPEDQDEDL